MSISLAVMVSGRGSNLEATLQAIKDKRLDARVEVVLSNQANVRAISIAQQYQVPAVVVESQGLKRQDHESKVFVELSRFKFDYLVLAGYMRVLSAQFLDHFKAPAGYYRVINIHPSLLPAFPGATAYEDAFAAGIAESGITVHLVDEHLDGGPIIAQARFQRRTDDTLEEFRNRGLEVEHRLLPETLQKISTSEIQLSSLVNSRRAACT